MGEVVLKPGVDPGYQEWLGTEVAAIQQRGFRLPAVRRAADGAWVVQGWAAQSAMPGANCAEDGAEWRAIIDASRALHAATTGLARPGLLARRTDPWALADRAAWGESRRTVVPELRDFIERLEPAMSPLGDAQLVHGDLTKNVLYSPGEPPTILDFSPYWRPTSYAEGIVIADALCWHHAPPNLLEEMDVSAAAVARGLLFRVLTAGRIHQRHSAALVEEAHRYRYAVTALNL